MPRNCASSEARLRRVPPVRARTLCARSQRFALRGKTPGSSACAHSVQDGTGGAARILYQLGWPPTEITMHQIGYLRAILPGQPLPGRLSAACFSRRAYRESSCRSDRAGHRMQSLCLKAVGRCRPHRIGGEDLTPRRCPSSDLLYLWIPSGPETEDCIPSQNHDASRRKGTRSLPTERKCSRYQRCPLAASVNASGPSIPEESPKEQEPGCIRLPERLSWSGSFWLPFRIHGSSLDRVDHDRRFANGQGQRSVGHPSRDVQRFRRCARGLAGGRHCSNPIGGCHGLPRPPARRRGQGFPKR